MYHFVIHLDYTINLKHLWKPYYVCSKVKLLFKFKLVGQNAPKTSLSTLNSIQTDFFPQKNEKNMYLHVTVMTELYYVIKTSMKMYIFIQQDLVLVVQILIKCDIIL